MMECLRWLWLWLWLWLICVLALTACSTPSTISLPDGEALKARRIEIVDVSELPPLRTRARYGDILCIIRDVQTFTRKVETTLFTVRSDGSFTCPQIGLVQAQSRTPEEFGEIGRAHV